MNRFYLTLVLAFVTAAHARLGETEKQLIERFGQPELRSQHSVLAQGKSWPLGLTLNFRQDGWAISCDLVGERVVRIQYQIVFWLIVALHQFVAVDYLLEWRLTRATVAALKGRRCVAAL